MESREGFKKVRTVYVEFGGDPSDDKEVYKRYCATEAFEPVGLDAEVVHYIEHAPMMSMVNAQQTRITELETILRKIRNSVALASWNVNPIFRDWSKDVNFTINQAVHDTADLMKKYAELEEAFNEMKVGYDLAYPHPKSRPHIEVVEFYTDPSEPFKYSVGTGGSGGSDGKK